MGRKKIQKRRDAGAANLKAYDQAVGATAIGPCSWNLGGSTATERNDDQISEEEIRQFVAVHGEIMAELSGRLQGICDAGDRVSLVLFVRMLNELTGKALTFYGEKFE